MRREPLAGSLHPNFVGCWNLENDSLCDAVIGYFDENVAAQKPGFIGAGTVDTSSKKSLDINISPKDLGKKESMIFAEYFQHLNQCFQDYTNQWDFLKTFLTRIHIGTFNVQKYNNGGHFSVLHSERTTLSTGHRVLVWMSYLNDVEGGGETEFPFFGLKVTPVKGKTLIWPAEWTHAHRGRVVETGPKYIITGWMHFPN